MPGPTRFRMALQMDFDTVAPEPDVTGRNTAVVERDLEAHRLAVPTDCERHVSDLDHRVSREQAGHVGTVSDNRIVEPLRGRSSRTDAGGSRSRAVSPSCI